MLLFRDAGAASHSKTSRSYYSKNQGFVEKPQISSDMPESIVMFKAYDIKRHFSCLLYHKLVIVTIRTKSTEIVANILCPDNKDGKVPISCKDHSVAKFVTLCILYLVNSIALWKCAHPYSKFMKHSCLLICLTVNQKCNSWLL